MITEVTPEKIDEVFGILVLTPILREVLCLGGVIDWGKYLTSQTGDSPSSSKFNVLCVNEDKAKVPHLHYMTPDKLDWVMMAAGEYKQADDFRYYRDNLANQRVILGNKADWSITKTISPSDNSRYFPEGRRRIKGKICKRLGRFYNCPGYLLSLTFDPSKISRVEAWKQVGRLRREFMNRVNRWRKRHGYAKVKGIPVIEVQPATGYPHVHIVFPKLKFKLAPIEWMREQWGQAENSVNYEIKDSMSPVSYVCKYISKLDGWNDVSLSHIWINRTRLYSLSKDYALPDGGHREPEWKFLRAISVNPSSPPVSLEELDRRLEALKHPVINPTVNCRQVGGST